MINTGTTFLHWQDDWTVSKDGLTYTTNCKDAKWYTADGEEYAPVTAQDFVM